MNRTITLTLSVAAVAALLAITACERHSGTETTTTRKTTTPDGGTRTTTTTEQTRETAPRR